MRREKYITITADNRDKGKTFFIREKSAVQAEKWAMRMLIAIFGSGKPMPKAGLAGLAEVGVDLLSLLGNVSWEMAEPLLDEMMECVQRKESEKCIRSLVDEDIEAVETLLQLRKEVLELHLGFSLAEKLQTLAPAAKETTGSLTT